MQRFHTKIRNQNLCSEGPHILSFSPLPEPLDPTLPLMQLNTMSLPGKHMSFKLNPGAARSCDFGVVD